MRLARSESVFILRFPIIPGYTDTRENLDQIITYLKQHELTNRQMDLLPFHNFASDKYRRFRKTDKLSDLAKPDEHVIQNIKKEFESIGMRVQIGG